MRGLWTGLGLLALAAAVTAGAVRPASAEFFGCDDKPGQVLSYDGHRAGQAASGYTHEYSAQARPRVTIHPRHSNATRHCRSWLAKEFRVSGTVIVPKTSCWWD